MKGSAIRTRARRKRAAASRFRLDLPSLSRDALRRAALLSLGPAATPEWTRFVVRCVHLWIASHASATAFLASWTPLGLPAFSSRSGSARRPARRRVAAARNQARRGARHPSGASTRTAWSGPIAAAGGAGVLRARYPLVTALLRELAVESGHPARFRRGV